MNSSMSRAGSLGATVATLLGSASLLTIASASAYAQEVAQAEEIPETVLITGSLIRGTAAVGVPVTNLTPMDFAVTGSLTTAELFRTFPAANVSPGAPATSAGNFVARNTRVNLRGLDTGDAVRSLLMVDGMRYPAQGQGLCMIDPSIIPQLALDHVDILVDGASATYGSDAIGGVINLVLKRNMDGATTQLRWTTAEGGKNRYLASAIWGRTWDGGQVTISYEWYNESPVRGDAHSNFTPDFTPWGFDDRRNLGSAVPPILSTGAARQPGNPPDFINTSAALGHGCTNCYAIPLGTGSNWEPGASGIGPTAPFSGSTLNWADFNQAANKGTNGLRNQFNPYVLSHYEPSQDRNAAVITVDQRLTRNISFYGEAFYTNRRARFFNPSNVTPTANNILNGFAVPTWNPYYPTGAPTTLRVHYNISYENPGLVSAHVLGDRYQMGLNIALPAGWSSQVWYAETFDKTAYNTEGSVNKSAVSAALGWTIGTTAASGSTPGIATWAKPANVPYLNVFCDATSFQCNSDATLTYITATRALDERYKINEKGFKADGPLFDLPGGPVKAAIGATYTTFAFNIVSLDNTGASSLVLPYQQNADRRAVWAVFTQVNIPIFSDANAIPFFRRLEVEGSWRHDQYSDVKGTSNPKVAFNWSPIEDLTIRGTWGNSFRAPSFGETSALANVAINGHNLILQGLAVSPDPIVAGCGPNGELPPEGSGAWKLMSSLGPGGDGSPGSASVCPSGSLALGSQNFDVRRLPGINILGGVGAAAPVRAGGFNGGPNLKPELATNWGIGFDYTPSGNILAGLNIQATYYQVKLNGTLRNFGQPNSSAFNDSDFGDNAVFVPTDWLDSGLPGAAACTSNLLPTTCQPFQDAVNGLLLHPRAQVSPLAQTLVMWIHDGGTLNRGWQKLDGIDFQASYDWELGDIGAFNAGIIGTYYLRSQVKSSPGSEVIDNLHQTVGTPGINESEGVETNPRFRYRLRLGWNNGPWSITGFMDYQSHYYHLQTPPPNVNGNFCASNGSLDALGMGGTYPCAIDNYTNLTPSWYSFDLSFGYQTMDLPSNEYLRNIGIQLVIQNVMDKHAPFQYKPSTAGGPPSAVAAFGGPGGGVSNAGRTISLILTKQW